MSDIYIKRRLSKRDKYYAYRGYFSFSEDEHFDLYSLTTERNKRIVILGDAGYGKSTELKALTKGLIDENNQNFIPVFIELSTYVDEEILDFVKCKIGEDSEGLLTYDKSRLVFLFDEFDQVLKKEIAVRKLKTFAEIYAKSTLIIACRSNFYSGQFEDFNIFVLVPFNSDDINLFARTSLKDESNDFLKQLENDNLFELAKNPFFLNYLVEIYQSDKRLAVTRGEIIPRIISLTIERDQKKLTDKYDLKRNYPAPEIRRDMRYISLIMETLQRNYFMVEELNKIVLDKTKSEVITELSLIKKSFFKEGDVYQFQHNNFQEYLVAEILADQSLNVILDFISFRSIIRRRVSWMEKFVTYFEYIDFKPMGIRIDKLLTKIFSTIRYKKINKINPSWANTVAFLCHLRKKQDLLSFLIKNEPELSLKFEISRIDEGIRSMLFKTVFNKYTNRKIWIDRDKIDYGEMAKFGNTEEVYKYLMRYASSEEHFIHRYNAIHMLGRMKGIKDDELCDLLIRYAKNENENQNVRHLCFYALSWLGMTSSDTIDALFNLKDTDDDWILSGLYHLIKESEYIDNYVDILLEGIPKIRQDFNSTKTRLGDEGWNLVEGLAKIQSVNGIKKIIRHFTSCPRDLREYNIERYIEIIVKNMIKAYEYDASIYEDVKVLVSVASKIFIGKAVTKFKIFFRETGTLLRLFKEVYQNGDEEDYSLLAALADEQCVDFMVDQYSRAILSEDNMWYFINLLSTKNRDDFDNLMALINENTNNKFIRSQPRDYEKENAERRKREIEIIFDRNEFLLEIEKMFINEGKKELGFENIEDLLFERYSENIYNEMVLRKLRILLEENKDKKWKYDDLKNKINQWNYKWFTFRHVFNLLYHDTQVELSANQKLFIKDFCLKNLEKVNFRDALKPKDGGVTANDLAVMLWYFLRKYDIRYPDEILLDMLSFDWIEGQQYVGTDYLENMLPHVKIKERILENINKGIEVEEVLKNHIDYCKRHNLIEARDDLYNIVNNSSVNIRSRMFALETVADYPNSTEYLEKVIDLGNSELFVKSAKMLIVQGNTHIKEKLRAKLLSKDEEYALASAKLLIGEQDLKAICFYSKHIKRTKAFKMDFANRNPLQRIKTIDALPILMDLLRFSYLYGDEILQTEFHKLDNSIIGILKNIAIQNYYNYQKVIKALQKFVKRNKSRFEDVYFLNVVCDDIEKAFLINHLSQLKVDEAIEKTKKLHL